MGLGWNPWRALRSRTHIEFELADLASADAVYGRASDGYAAILISRRLSVEERADALAHELIHDERGGGCPTAGMPAEWSAVARREERTVQNEVARRRVPLDMLGELVDALDVMGLPIEVWDIAQQFGVSEPVARLAMELLRQERDGAAA